MTGEPIDVSGYVVTDPFFGEPYLDEDTTRDDPLPHRMVHGGFAGTDTRFRFYFPGKEHYAGRMITPLFGGHGGTEDFFGSPFGILAGGLPMIVRLGAYMVESNQGHIGDDVDPKGGDDPTIYGHRASNEVARLSRYVAAQVYGEPPHHCYVFGGSGGGRRSPLCLENGGDVYDGAVPYMGGGDIAPRGSTRRIKGAQVMSFASMFNCQRILGTKLADVIDAMAPGGSGNPFLTLDTHQREELASLYRQGYPRGDEFMIGQPMGQTWLWTSIAEMLEEQDPTYFADFWTKPGYVGHDQPELVSGDLIDETLVVTRVLTATDLLEAPEFAGSEHQAMRTLVSVMASAASAFDVPFAVQLEGVKRDGYRLGAGLRVVSGAASGRQLYANFVVSDAFYCDGPGEANLLRFSGVLPGDEIHLDNHKFLAFCYFARHHLMDDEQFDSLRVDGVPIFQQHPVPEMSPLMGVSYSGEFSGKLIWIHHTHDASLWPPQGVIYERAVVAAQGSAGAAERFRLRWTENAEHGAPERLASAPNRASKTWLIDYQPIVEQTLVDLIGWVERGVSPAATSYEYRDGKVTLPPTAAERGGIQPVVSVSANGDVRAEVRTGEPVTLEVRAEAPPGAGTVVDVEWDFEGTGAYEYRHEEVDGTASAVKLATTHTYDRPGNYFVTARVHSHRDGDVRATTRRIPNLAQARVIVT
ncbi:MAG: PKD domain-containing protein [Acidimicrobiales bacterium]